MNREKVQLFFTIIFLGVFAIALLEGVLKTYWLKQDYDWKESWTSLGVAIGRRLVELLPLGFALPFGAWLYEHRLWDLTLNWQSLLALFFLLEFFYYWFHRISHRVRYFWASHAVHHSPNRFNLSMAYRLGWTGKLTGTLITIAPICWLGFPPLVVLAAFALNLLYQFWIHAEWIPKLGLLEGWLNTPSAHRVHHAANTEYLDANYGGVLLIFDRLFGTYIPEQDHVKTRYGWVNPIVSHNIFVVALSPWANLLKDVWQEPLWPNKMRYFYKAPGWHPDPTRNQTTETLRARVQN